MNNSLIISKKKDKDKIMEKNRIAEELKEKGYDASGSDGIVMVRYAPGTYEETRKEIESFLGKMGYNASWGLISIKRQGSATDELIKANVEETDNALNAG